MSSSLSSLQRIKLRNACNRCCDAKVKCSGEKTGCGRCRSRGTYCVYMESRVGKVQGIRSKKRHNGNGSEFQPVSGRVSSPAGRITTNRPAIVPTNFEFQVYERNRVLPWEADSTIAASFPSEHTDTAGLQGDFADINVTNHCASDSSSSYADTITTFPRAEEFNISSMDDTDLEDMLVSHSPLSAHLHLGQVKGSSSSHLGSQVPVQSRSRREIDSQCCIECCQTITELESLIMSGLRAFRIVLEIVRGVFERLTRIIELQRGSKNMKCIMMIASVLYQVLEVLETCLSAATMENDRPRDRSLEGGGLFALGLNGFSMDIEEQSALRGRLIMKEIKKAAEVLQNLRDLAGGGLVSAPETRRGDTYLDIELRLKDLATQLVRNR